MFIPLITGLTRFSQKQPDFAYKNGGAHICGTCPAVLMPVSNDPPADIAQ
jgi:hypothetical protein